MSLLSDKTCKPCTKVTLPLTIAETTELSWQLRPRGWRIVEEPQHHLIKNWDCLDFEKLCKFVMTFCELATQENHHPDFKFGYDYLELTLYTHAINGLSENDFILAAKIDNIDRWQT